MTRRTETSIAFSWGPSTGHTGLAGYGVYEYLGGRWKLVGYAATSGRSFDRRGLHRRTRHRFEVRAYDAAGDLSAPLIGAWVTTS